MNTELVKALLVEIDGNTEKLRRALREGGVELDKFGGKAKQSGQTSSTASDAVAGRQANAARAIAATTETIARQGKVTGETGKALIAQAANAAFAWGKNGPIVAAVGISTLAIVGLFTRIKREAKEAAEEARKDFDRMASLDLAGISREVSRLDTGDYRLRQQLASDDPAVRAAALERFRADRTRIGMAGLPEERARQQAQLDALGPLGPVKPLSEQTAADRTKSALRRQLEQELAAIDAALAQLRPKRDAAQELLGVQLTESQFGSEAQLASWRREASGDSARDAAKEMAQERERLSQLSGAAQEALYTEFQKALLEGFNGTRAEVEQSFAEMVQFAEEHGEQAEIPVLVNARDRALELLDLKARIDAAFQDTEFATLWDDIAATEDQGISGSFAAQLQQLRLLRDEALAFSNDERRSAKDREAALKTAASLQAQISTILKDSEPKQVDITRSLADQAREVADMVDGVLQLAAAWGSVSDSTINVLRGLTSMAGALPGLLDSFTALDKARKAGSGVGMAKLGVVGAALPIVGALATIAGGLFGSSPAEQERKRIQRENTKALQDLTRQVSLFGLDVSGSAFGAARGGVGAILGGSQELTAAEFMRMQRRGILGGGGAWRAGMDVNIAGLSDSARIDWSRFSDVDRRALEDAAAALGITIDGTVGSLRALQSAIDEVEGRFGEFSDSFADRQTLADAQMDLLGIESPAERLKLGTAVAQSMSPAIAKLLEGIDLQSAADRSKLRDSLLDVLEKLQAGGDAFTAADFGGLTPDEFWQTIQQIIAGLGSIDGSVASAGTSMGGLSGFRGLTEAAGERLADYQRTLVGIGRDSLSVLQQQLAYLAKMAGTPLLAPPMPLGFGSGNMGAVAITLQINGPINLGDVHLMLEPGTDPERAGQAAMRVMGQSLEQVLYDALVRAKRAGGDLSIVGPLR